MFVDHIRARVFFRDGFIYCYYNGYVRMGRNIDWEARGLVFTGCIKPSMVVLAGACRHVGQAQEEVGGGERKIYQ